MRAKKVYCELVDSRPDLKAADKQAIDKHVKSYPWLTSRDIPILLRMARMERDSDRFEKYLKLSLIHI